MICDIFIVCIGVVCFLMGWGFCKLFGCRKKKDEPCETLDDILQNFRIFLRCKQKIRKIFDLPLDDSQ